MSRAPLMPKATAVWLVENTALSFKQIADFCNLHELEIKGIADGDVAAGIKGLDPVTGGQLTRSEIEKGEADPDYRLKVFESKVNIPVQRSTAGPRYTPVSRRGDRPDAIVWLLRYHPELPESAIMKLVGTTKSTIAAIRDRTHWNAANIKPVDPVSLGLCSQLDLDFAVQKAARKAGKPQAPDAEPARTLIPAAEVAGTAAYQAAAAAAEQAAPASDVRDNDKEYDADSVFAKLKTLKRDDDQE
ncbi:DUF1013 domain-containing protein [Aestuariivirga sp.]|uniref:DUF1013 domain-containing protein n=1 Tax=Aestuariivirga sp. TaxID=2650926 RepID=UPI0039E548B7